MLKLLQFSITCLLLFLFTSGAFAQEGTVAAGCEATGTGGSMSYSIGQVDYLMYSSCLESNQVKCELPTHLSLVEFAKEYLLN